MAKVYLINCRDVGVECEFQARGHDVEEVIELCAQHGREAHGMHSFAPGFYAKMRQCLSVIEEEAAPLTP